MNNSSEHTYSYGSVTAMFARHAEAEKAIKALKDGGFDVRKLSIIGTDYHSENARRQQGIPHVPYLPFPCRAKTPPAWLKCLSEWISGEAIRSRWPKDNPSSG